MTVRTTENLSALQGYQKYDVQNEYYQARYEQEMRMKQEYDRAEALRRHMSGISAYNTGITATEDPKLQKRKVLLLCRG